jgi:hypothetical protein
LLVNIPKRPKKDRFEGVVCRDAAGHTLVVSKADERSRVTSGRGPMNIDDNYHGNFIFDGITNITGYSVSAPGGYDWGLANIAYIPPKDNPQMTYFQMADLVGLNELSLWNAPKMSVILTNLQWIWSLLLYNVSSTLSLPSLIEADRIILIGDFP